MSNQRFHHNNTEQGASKKAFRDKFGNQIQRLIGREPRLVKQDNGTYAIYYEYKILRRAVQKGKLEFDCVR